MNHDQSTLSSIVAQIGRLEQGAAQAQMPLAKDQQGFKIALPTKLAHSMHMMLYGEHHPAILRHEMGMGFGKKGERLPDIVITRGIPLDKATERLLKHPEERA